MPGNLQPGIYRLKVSVYGRGQALAGQQRTVLRLAYLPALHSRQVDATTSAGWEVAGLSWGQDGAGGLVVTLTGSVQSEPKADYTWFAHVLDAKGRVIAQDDHPPVAAAHTWQPGDRLSEVFRMDDSAKARWLELGAYTPAQRRAIFRMPDRSRSNRILVALRPSSSAQTPSKPTVLRSTMS